MVKLSKIPAFGFLKENTKIGSKVMPHSAVVWHNLRKTAGYIPGLSLIQGIEHLVRAVKHKSEYSSHFILRSIVEMLGLGFFLLIPDLIITCVRQHKSHTASLQARKIVPMPTPQTAPNPVFPEKVETFLQPVERKKSTLEIIKKSRDPAIGLITKQFTKLVSLNKVSRFPDYLEQLDMDFSNKESIAVLKQFMLDQVSQSDNAVLHLACYLYKNGALSESPEDIQFYQALGIKLAEIGACPIEFLEKLDLDLNQEACLKAVTAIAMADAKANPGEISERIHKYGFNDTSETHETTLFEIAKVAIQNDPAGTLVKLNKYGIYGQRNAAAITAYAEIKGNLEERKAVALKLLSCGISKLIQNLPYLDFDWNNEQEQQVIKEIALEAFLSEPEITFKKFGVPLSLPLNTPEGSAFWRSFAMEVAKRDYNKALILKKLLHLSLKDPNSKEILVVMGIELFRKDPFRTLKKQFKLGIEGIIDSELAKLCMEPVAMKESILKECLEKSPGSFLKSCEMILKSSKPEESELKKKLTAQFVCQNILSIHPGSFDIATLKEMILLGLPLTPPNVAGFFIQLPALKKLGLTPENDLDFFSSLACELAKKEPNTLLYYNKTIFDPKEEKGFQTLRQIGLAMAYLDGTLFMQKNHLLGFDVNNAQHTAALQEMRQVAYADIGPKAASKFIICRTPFLSMKQFCNLVACYHAGQFNPKFFDYVLPTEWASPAGLIAREQLAVQLAGMPYHLNHDDMLAKLLQGMPSETKKNTLLAIANKDTDADHLKLAYDLAKRHDELRLYSFLKIHVDRLGPYALCEFTEEINDSKDFSPKARLILYKCIVQLNPSLVHTFKCLDSEKEILLKLAIKKGSLEERQQEALKEAGFSDSSILENMPFYNLEDPMPAYIKAFSVNPYPFFKKWRKESWSWEQAKKIVLNGIKDLNCTPNAIKKILNAHTHLCHRGDPDFRFELLKLVATKGTQQLKNVIKQFRLSQVQLKEVEAIAAKHDKSNLLKPCEMQVPLEERAQIAIQAIKYNPPHVSNHVHHYFSQEEIENQKVPEEVVQAYLTATCDLQGLTLFGKLSHRQIQVILEKAAQNGLYSHKLLDLAQLKSIANLSMHNPTQRTFLFKLTLLVAQKHPVPALDTIEFYHLVLTNDNDLAFLGELFKRTAKKNSSATHSYVNKCAWDLSKKEQYSTLKEVIIATAKEVGDPKGFKLPPTWRAIKLMKEVHDEFPPGNYKNVFLYPHV